MDTNTKKNEKINERSLPLSFRYSVNAQIICDLHGRIIALDAGSPGAASDSTVFKSMEQSRDPANHFSPGEYLLADSAYAVSVNCVPAYKAPAADLPDNTSFNFYLARSRVRNEHCIGVLKGRWQSLRELRHQIQDDDRMENLCRWVLACAVLHNIMAKINDRWPGELADEDRREDFIPAELWFQPTITALTFRETLKKTTLETNRARRRR